MKNNIKMQKDGKSQKAGRVDEPKLRILREEDAAADREGADAQADVQNVENGKECRFSETDQLSRSVDEACKALKWPPSEVDSLIEYVKKHGAAAIRRGALSQIEAWNAGRALRKLKKLIPHGLSRDANGKGWIDFVVKTLGFKERTARHWMQMAKNYPRAEDMKTRLLKHGLPYQTGESSEASNGSTKSKDVKAKHSKPENAMNASTDRPVQQTGGLQQKVEGRSEIVPTESEVVLCQNKAAEDDDERQQRNKTKVEPLNDVDDADDTNKGKSADTAVPAKGSVLREQMLATFDACVIKALAAKKKTAKKRWRSALKKLISKARKALQQLERGTSSLGQSNEKDKSEALVV